MPASRHITTRPPSQIFKPSYGPALQSQSQTPFPEPPFANAFSQAATMLTLRLCESPRYNIKCRAINHNALQHLNPPPLLFVGSVNTKYAFKD